MYDVRLFEPDNEKDKIIKNFKLKFEVLPPYAHGKSVREIIGQSLWQKIRIEVLQKYNNTCQYCESKPEDGQSSRNWHIHEEWVFDEKNFILNLTGLNVVCANCHNSHHIGRYEQLVRNGISTWDNLFDHMAKVNNCSKDMIEYAYLRFKYGILISGEVPCNRNKDLLTANWKYSIPKDIPFYDKVEKKLEQLNLLK